MPPSRRKSNNPATRSSNPTQATLSFHNKSARVSKPSIADSTAAKKASSRLSEPAEIQILESTSLPTKPQPEPTEEVATVDVPQPVASESEPKPKPKAKRAAAPRDEADVAAEKITDAQLRRYWQAEEDSRLAPRGNN